MGLSNGFKQTDIGIIPEDWEVIAVSDITASHKQGFYTKDRYVDQGTYLVRITDLLNPRISFADMPKLKVSQNDFSLFKIKRRDFLFARSGAIGRYGIVYEDVEAIFGSYIIRFTFDPKRVVNEYFGFLYETELVWKQLLSITQGSSNININANNIKSLRIPLPPLSEQQVISTVLSDVDALTAALDRLIAKKRDIKQAAMQELLTGKRRLPGFSGEWEARTLDEMTGKDGGIVDGPFGSNMKTSDYVNRGIPVLQGLNITHDKFVWKDVRYVSSEKAKELYRSNARRGDLLTVKIGSVGFSAVIDDLDGNEYAIIPANLLRSRFDGTRAYTKFMHYLLTSFDGKKKLVDLAGNTAQPALSLTGFRNLTFMVPSSLEEQHAIAEVLSDIDAEIAALEQKRDKTRLLKQGMLQELLTGRIRLV